MNKKYPRIFIGPTEIAGYYSNLTKGFKEIGICCDFFSYYSHAFEYGGESEPSYILKKIRLLKKYQLRKKNNIFKKFFLVALAEFLSLIWTIRLLSKYDIFIFGFGNSLMRNNIDLLILKLFNKKIISNFAHGSEARPPYIDGFHQSSEGINLSINVQHHLTKKIKKRIVYHEKFCNLIIGSPYSTSHFANKKNINSFALGIPFDTSPKEERKITFDNHKKVHSGKIIILHSPSHAAAKGTNSIVNIIDRLKKKGYLIEFILIQGKPFNDVLTEIQKCDFVVDQIYSDTPLAGFATEAAWFGKPSVVGGYGLSRLKSYIPLDMWPPSKICAPDEMEYAIEDLILNIEERRSLGLAAKKFVREKWKSAEVARRYLQLIEGNIPDQWWLDPSKVDYLEGAGQSIEKSKEAIRALVKNYGVESLQLAHRPALEKSFLKFTNINE
jgi:hypothetical protein